MVRGNFKCSLEKRPPCLSVCPCLFIYVYDGGGGGGWRKKLKIHKALSGDEAKCCQSI